jgi:hypothetical protein
MQPVSPAPTTLAISTAWKRDDVADDRRYTEVLTVRELDDLELIVRSVHHQPLGALTVDACDSPLQDTGGTRLSYGRRRPYRAIEAVEQLANDPQFYLDMTFEPGDMQWLKNSVILHKRTAYEDHDALDDKRHLIRLWLRADDFEDGDAQLRGGIQKQDFP